jgi:hypothetical protein
MLLETRFPANRIEMGMDIPMLSELRSTHDALVPIALQVWL